MDSEKDSSNYLPPSTLKKIYFFLGLGIFVFILILNIIYLVNNQPTPFENYISSTKSLYVKDYVDGDIFINFTDAHNFTKVYFYIGSIKSHYSKLVNGEVFEHGNYNFSYLFEQLKKKGKEVVPFIYLNEDYDEEFSGYENIPNVCEALKHNFTTLLLDIEPPEKSYFEKLLGVYENCVKHIKVSAMILSEWRTITMQELQSFFISSDYYKKFQHCDTIVDAIMEVTNYTIFKASSNKYEEVDSLLEDFDKIREKHTNNIAIPILDMDQNNEESGLYQRYNESNDEFFKYFVKVSEKYKGVAINDFLLWYKDLYCLLLFQNKIYYSGKPFNCTKKE